MKKPYWNRMWSAVIAVGLTAGIIVACSDQASPVAPTSPEVGAVAGPQFDPPLTNPCTLDNPGWSGSTRGHCTEIYGTDVTLDVLKPPATNPTWTFQCKATGHPLINGVEQGSWAHVPNDQWITQSPAHWSNTWSWSVHPYMTVANGNADTVHYTLNVTPKHPTAGTDAVPISCYIDDAQGAAQINVTISGPPPALKSIDALSGATTISVGQSEPYAVATYTDDYNFQNAMTGNPPQFTWSSNKSSTVASVDPNTGVVTGIGAGTARITATSVANNSITKYRDVTVVACTGVTFSNPSSFQMFLYGGATQSTTATASCGSADGTHQQITWSTTVGGIVTPTGSGNYNRTGTVNPNLGGGTTQVKACLLYQPTVCGQITANVARIIVTDGYASKTDTFPLNTAEHYGFFTVTNAGYGTWTLSMSCGSTGAVTCNGLPTPASQSLAPTAWVVPVVHFTTAAFNGTGKVFMQAFNGTLGSYVDTVNIVVSNTTGLPLTASNPQLPNPVRANVACSWDATVTGGTTPYSYTWTVDGVDQGVNSPTLTYTNSGSAFTIDMLVTDALGATASWSLPVTIAGSGPDCSS